MLRTLKSVSNLVLKPLIQQTSSIEAAISTRLFHVTSKAEQQQNPKIRLSEGIQSVDILKKDRLLDITFNNDVKGHLPFLWLRDNCQCSECFDHVALGRRFLLQTLDMKVVPSQVELGDKSLKVLWSDNHQSEFEVGWLQQRAFNSEVRANYRDFHRLQQEPWGKDMNIDQFTYEDLMNNETALLKWILTMEVKGASLIKDTPDDPDAAPLFIEHVGFVKQTHYGRRSPVLIRENSNNLAYTNVKLGLHNDLPQYIHQPGLIFLHTVEPHPGQGGESTISDGLMATNILRAQHPKAFDLLTKTDVYFWDKGSANLIELENEEFYKINKGPIIGLNNRKQLNVMRMNNQVRDSHLDLHPTKVNEFYEALRTLSDTLRSNSYSFKMAAGDILALDNVRCLHGREKFDQQSVRHLETSYMDWDDALCRRRRLQVNLEQTQLP